MFSNDILGLVLVSRRVLEAFGTSTLLVAGGWHRGKRWSECKIDVRVQVGLNFIGVESRRGCGYKFKSDFNVMILLESCNYASL